MRIIATANQKGGTGKTATAINLGAALALKGKAVLLLDLDPQSALTASLLGPGGYEMKGDIYRVMKGDMSLGAVIRDRPPLKLIPSTLRLTKAEPELISTPGREFILKEAIGGLREPFDFLILDTPPSLGLLTINALTSAGEVVVPVQVEYLALRGLAELRDTIELVHQRLNPNLHISAVIPTRFDGRRRLNCEVLDNLKEHFGELVTRPVRENIALAESSSAGKTIFEYKRLSHAAEDYAAIADEIEKRGNP